MTLLLSAVLSCASLPEGLRETPDGIGPLVRVDWDAIPLPEIPFPNDLATRSDPTSPTGLRLNIAAEAPTRLEREARENFNRLTGFGIFAPMAVAFEAPLDLDNIYDRQWDDGDFSDDAFYVINVDPDSPDYGKPAYLDIGHGRFPMDLDVEDRYFPNDPHGAGTALYFETIEEDVNGNGRLDAGEDTDHDGVLDHPNVYPDGGSPRQDLMTWYERETDTLIMRVVRPLREETTYAVVLTERLVGEDGEPVRSPWEWVNHTRQTEALRPLEEILPELGVGRDELAYAWTFTTGRVTGDLVDIRRGFDGEGPWPFLQEDFPGKVNEALVMQEQEGGDPYLMPMGTLMDTLTLIGLFDSTSGAVIGENYNHFAMGVVGGSFTSASLIYDRDDGGVDTTDEIWITDPVGGTLEVGTERIPFTCIIPAEREGVSPPYDVVLFGHGYGSSRFDTLGFAHIFNRLGMAGCGMDFPGHGATITAEQEALLEAYLRPQGLMPFADHIFDDRARDLTNDGRKDSGYDQWTSDGFHTRDMVRQAAVDWMMMIRSLQNCGTGTMARGEDTSLTCDWDDDGQADIGGPDAKFYVVGGSLGGIDSSILAAVEPSVSAVAPIVGGAGLMDIGARSSLSGAVEAVVGRLMTPLFLGYPTEDGGLEVVQYVSQYMEMQERRIGVIDTIPAGGTVTVYNLDNGEIRQTGIPDDGRFRVGLPCDALDAFEKREIAGIPHTGPEFGAVYQFADTAQLGDRLRIHIQQEDGRTVADWDTWPEETFYEGITMPEGSELVALSEGLGHQRASPDLRRLVQTISLASEPGDPISYAPHYLEDPFESLWGDAGPNVLLISTPGDTIVSINSQMSLARVAGLVESFEVDERYGTTVDRWLIENEVVRGLEQWGPFTCDGSPCLFDPDDLDEGLDELDAPSDTPWRETVESPWGGITALRMPYVARGGSHGPGLPNPDLPFDVNTWFIYQVGHYFLNDGTALTDDHCMEDASCEWIPQLEDSR